MVVFLDMSICVSTTQLMVLTYYMDNIFFLLEYKFVYRDGEHKSQKMMWIYKLTGAASLFGNHEKWHIIK